MEGVTLVLPIARVLVALNTALAMQSNMTVEQSRQQAARGSRVEKAGQFVMAESLWV